MTDLHIDHETDRETRRIVAAALRAFNAEAEKVGGAPNAAFLKLFECSIALLIGEGCPAELIEDAFRRGFDAGSSGASLLN